LRESLHPLFLAFDQASELRGAQLPPQARPTGLTGKDPGFQVAHYAI
jgi:hypothetical protein